MRIALSIAACLLASTAMGQAETILTRADLRAATVYAGQAEMTRQARLTLPAGTHRVRIAMPNAMRAELPQVTTDAAVSLGPLSEEQGVPVAEGGLDTAEQAAARAAVDTARDALQEVQDRIAAADATIRATSLQMTHLEALARGGEDGADMPDDPAALTERLSILGTEMARVSQEALQAQIARRALTEELETRQADLQAAEFALQALRPFGTTVDVLALDISAEAETDLVLDLSYSSWGASWNPVYEYRLDTETGALRADRFIALSIPDGEVWQDVAVTFSADDPNRVRVPTEPRPDPARIAPPAPAADRISREPAMGGALQSIAPAPVVAEESAALMVAQGLAVSYVYREPVSVGASGQALLPFDSLTFEAELTNLAVPRHNSTAFLVAAFENDSGAPILPGEARFFRDGALIGADWVGLIPAGAEEEMAFGPLDHLRLTWQDLSLDEGDRGIFVQSNTQDRRIEFSVENTSATAEEVRMLYATPFAEQEDLDVDVTLSRDPDDRDVDGLRGVVAWTLTVPAGATETIEMGVSLDWPEGQILTWRP